MSDTLVRENGNSSKILIRRRFKLDASKFPKLEEFEKNPLADKTLYDKYLKEVTGYDSDYDYTESNPNIESFELNDWYAELGRAVPT